MLTTELKKSGSNDVVVQGKLIINISSNTGGTTSTNGRLQTPSTSNLHNRTPSIISAVSSIAGSSANARYSLPAPSSPIGTTQIQSQAVTPAATSTANGGRQLSAHEDQFGALPTG